MKRILAALLAAMVVSGPHVVRAADTATPRGPNPFEQVLLPHPPPRSHLGSNLAFLAGAGLIAGSFTLAHTADTAYDRYLAALSPGDIGYWYDRSTRYDRLSSGALLGGEALVATGLYLRFLHRPASSVSVVLAPRTCAVSLRF